MGYISDIYGIKTARGLEKHIYKLTAKEVIVIKTADHLKVIWALNDELYTYDINAHTIYVVEEEALDKAVKVVMDSMTDHVTKVIDKPIIPIGKVEEMNCLDCIAITGHHVVDGRWSCVHCGTPKK